MRPMGKEERQITEDEMYQILENAEYATLCTISVDDGAPYRMPISYVVKNRVLYIHMAEGGQRLDNLKGDSRVHMTCVGQTLLYPEQYSTDFESVIVTGRAGLVTNHEEEIEALRTLCEKCGLPGGGMFLEKKIGGGMDRVETTKVPVGAISGEARWRKPKPPVSEKAWMACNIQGKEKRNGRCGCR